MVRVPPQGVGSDRTILTLTDEELSEMMGNDIVQSAMAIVYLETRRAVNVLKNLSGDLIQAILYQAIYIDLFKVIDILVYGASDVTLSADTTFTGVNRFGILDLNGYTYVADGQPHVIIASKVVDSQRTGSIVKTPTGGSGGAPCASPGRGGDGGGGLIILANEVSVPLITCDGADGESGSNTENIGGGSDGGPGYMIVYPTTLPGSGGNGGRVYNGKEGYGGNPGGGGGGQGGYGHRGGNGGTISIEYGDVIELALKAAIDYWIVNVLGKSLTSQQSFPNVYGAGGGGGGDCDDYNDAGGGGGSGGEVVIVGRKVFGRITARGGNGGNGGNEGYDDAGGGGGGGGVVYVLGRKVSVQIDVSGGSGGSGDHSGENGTSGSYAIFYA